MKKLSFVLFTVLIFTASSYAGWIEVVDHDIKSGERTESEIFYVSSLAPMKLEIWARTRVVIPCPTYAYVAFEAKDINGRSLAYGSVTQTFPGTKSKVYYLDGVSTIWYSLKLDVVGVAYARAKLYFQYL